MTPRASLVLVVVWCAVTLVYAGYAATRTPALVFARDAAGSVTVARERWVQEPVVEVIDPTRGAPDLRLEPTGRASCRLVLAARPAPGRSEDLVPLASWARRSGCVVAEHDVDSAARSLASGAPFRTRVPVTGGHVWWPLPLLVTCLVLFERRRRALAASTETR